jgi:hypothetical protein
MNAEALYQIYKSLEDQLELPPLFAAILELLPRFGADFGSLLIQETNDQLHYLSSIPGREGMVGPAGRRFAYRLLTDGFNPTASTIAPNPSATPKRWGRVRRKPKFAPDASNIMLFGPGVIDDTKQNVASAKSIASLMRYTSTYRRS